MYCSFLPVISILFRCNLFSIIWHSPSGRGLGQFLTMYLFVEWMTCLWLPSGLPKAMTMYSGISHS